ncbi:hypothetical protein Trydic_g1964 [Trypoxylus dichotomus]
MAHNPEGNRSKNEVQQNINNREETQQIHEEEIMEPYSVGPEEDTHIHIPTGSTDVLDIAVVKNVTTPYHLETINDLTSDHLPVVMTLSLDKNLAATTTHTTNWLEFEKQLDPRPIIIKRTSDIDDMV